MFGVDWHNGLGSGGAKVPVERRFVNADSPHTSHGSFTLSGH